MIRHLSRSELLALVSRHAAALEVDDNPFASAVFTQHLLDQVARDDWRFMAVEGPGASLTLLYAEPQSPSQWRALTNYYSSQYSPFAGGAAGGPGDALARLLAADRPAPATVDLSPLCEADAERAAAEFKRVGWITRRYACFGNWYLPCEGLSFEAYMAGRPSQTVNTWTRKAKKFKPGNPEARLQLVTDPAEVAAAMQAYTQVYAKSWKQAEPYPTFVADWAAICARHGWLRLGIAWAGETPIAAQFWFTRQRRAYIYKLAYDEDFSKLSAGTVLSAFMFRQALDEDRVVEIDYLTGDDPYKRAWMTHRRERVGLIACNPRTLRGAGRALYELAGSARQLLRQRSSLAEAPAAA